MSDTRIPFVDGSFDFWKLYDNGEWEPETKAILERFLHPGDLFIDIGAWIGPVTLWAVELGARVIALEPDPIARESLAHHVDGLAVSIYGCAIAAENGTGYLDNPRYFGDSMSRLGDVGTPVQTVSPSWLMNHLVTPPTLMKLDIEGGEIDVLPTLLPILRTAGIPIYLAWHEAWWSRDVSLEERQSWFEGFDTDGSWDGWGQLLAVPR